MTIGERIKRRREELGISVGEVANRLGKHRATIYRYESDEIGSLPIDILEPLAIVLETTPAALMGWDEDAPAAPQPPEPAPPIDNPDIRMIARAGRKMTAEQAADLRKFAEYMYPEAFKDDE